MIRGQIQLPDEAFRLLTGFGPEMVDWLRLAQHQLISLPEVIHFEDLEGTTFPDSDEYTAIYLGFDIYLKDTDWHSLRGGQAFSVGDAIPSSFTPVPPVDYTTTPIGTTRVLFNNTGAAINSGTTVPSTGLQGVRMQSTGIISDPTGNPSIGTSWYSFAKISNGEAGDFIRVA